MRDRPNPPEGLPVDESFHKSILDNLYDGVYYVDRDRRITYWNQGAERISGYSSDEVVGHRCQDELLMHVDDGGRLLCGDVCPLAETMGDGVLREKAIYLHHRDGHRVPVQVRAAPIRDEGGRIVGGVEIFSDNTEYTEAQKRVEDLQRLALLDAVTGLGNRHFLETWLGTRLDELSRYGWMFAVLFCDIDEFKSVNDVHGHEAGDAVLRMVAATMEHALRGGDVVGRWGGEEFVAVLTHSDAAGMAATAERLRALVQRSALTIDGRTIRVTMSVGGTLALEADSVETLVGRADGLMYRSKTGGRDRVTLG